MWALQRLQRSVWGTVRSAFDASKPFQRDERWAEVHLFVEQLGIAGGGRFAGGVGRSRGLTHLALERSQLIAPPLQRYLGRLQPLLRRCQRLGAYLPTQSVKSITPFPATYGWSDV